MTVEQATDAMAMGAGEWTRREPALSDGDRQRPAGVRDRGSHALFTTDSCQPSGPWPPCGRRWCLLPDNIYALRGGPAGGRHRRFLDSLAGLGIENHYRSIAETEKPLAS